MVRAATLGRPAALRVCLYMAAVATARGSNPTIAGFYKRLRQAGKPAKLALTACMRELVVTLNAMLRTDTAWEVGLKPDTAVSRSPSPVSGRDRGTMTGP